MQAILTEARRNLVDIDEREFRQGTWSLGHVGGVPDDASGQLLKLEMYCRDRGRWLTIGQARIASRLRWIAEAGGDPERGQIVDPETLYAWAVRFHNRVIAEEVVDVNEKGTEDLDTQLLSGQPPPLNPYLRGSNERQHPQTEQE